MVHTHERLVQHGSTGRRAQTDAIMAEAEAWRERCRLAWRGWFDQQAEQGSATSPGGGDVGPRVMVGMDLSTPPIRSSSNSACVNPTPKTL
jgi:hypothetical protein